jgi:hypothetical protein
MELIASPVAVQPVPPTLRRMRTAAVVVLALGVVVAAAGAATVDPSALVLRASDVPRAYTLDRTESGLRTNEQEGRNEPGLRRLYQRARRVTGYEVEYVNRGNQIGARVDLFRGSDGARIVLEWFGVEMRKAGIQGLMRTQGSIGDESWVYSARGPAPFAIVAWRYRRAFSGVAATGLNRARVLELARVQQRRIAAALR